MRLRDTKGQALTADRSHVAQTKEVMLCVHLILLPTIVLPLASTGHHVARPLLQVGGVAPVADELQDP